MRSPDPHPLGLSQGTDEFVLRFEHTVTTPADDTLYFAFCFPESYTDIIARLAWFDTSLASGMALELSIVTVSAC